MKTCEDMALYLRKGNNAGADCYTLEVERSSAGTDDYQEIAMTIDDLVGLVDLILTRCPDARQHFEAMIMARYTEKAIEYDIDK